jgi:hypothetical protein
VNVVVTAMGQALHQAARGRPGVTVYDTDQLLAPIAGTAAAHQADGIHLSIEASQKISYLLVQRLRADATSE